MTMRGRSIGSPTSAETIPVPASVAVRGIERGASRSPFRLWAVVAVLAATAGAPASAADLLAGQQKAESCGRCHGLDGNATIPGIPSLAGQPAFFTHWQLIKFRDGRRKDPQMAPFAANLSDADMGDLAAVGGAAVRAGAFAGAILSWGRFRRGPSRPPPTELIPGRRRPDRGSPGSEDPCSRGR